MEMLCVGVANLWRQEQSRYLQRVRLDFATAYTFVENTKYMQQLHPEIQHLRSATSTLEPISTLDLGSISNLGNLTIVDDAQRSRVVKLIADLLAAKIPVTMINDREQAIPFQEVFYDFDGKYIYFNPAAIDPAEIDMQKDLLLEIPGHRLATYLADRDPIATSIDKMLEKRFTAFPLSFVIIEKIDAVGNDLLKPYLDRILNRGKNGVQAIWSCQAEDDIDLPDRQYGNPICDSFFLTSSVLASTTSDRAEKYENN
jgi:hypothetical protein